MKIFNTYIHTCLSILAISLLLFSCDKKTSMVEEEHHEDEEGSIELTQAQFE